MSTPVEKPNILLITDDQHRFDFFEGGAVAGLKTPNWNRLKSMGTTFSHAVSNCPICMPCRFSWYYGVYASQGAAGLLRNAHDWPTHLPSMPWALQKQGYHTAIIGKVHSHAGLRFLDLVEYEQQTRDRGFDYVFETSGKGLAYWFDCNWTRHLRSIGKLDYYRNRFVDIGTHFAYGEEIPLELETQDTMDGFTARKGCEWLESYEGDKPFFCHISLCGPHFPLDPPAEYWERWKDADVPPPEGVVDSEEPDDWRQRRRAYCAMIELLDDQLGLILDTAEKQGLLDNTVIVYTCDHGDMMGTRGLWHKGKTQDPSSRVALIVAGPDIGEPGRVCDSPVESVDLPATILSLAGCSGDIGEVLPNSPGRSLWPGVLNEGAQGRGWAYSEGRDWRMCRERDWKYVWRDNGTDELFDMVDDPWETRNLIDEPGQQERVSRMRRELLQSMSSVMAPDTIAVPPVIKNPTDARAGKNME